MKENKEKLEELLLKKIENIVEKPVQVVAEELTILPLLAHELIELWKNF